MDAETIILHMSSRATCILKLYQKCLDPKKQNWWMIHSVSKKGSKSVSDHVFSSGHVGHRS